MHIILYRIVGNVKFGEIAQLVLAKIIKFGDWNA